MRVDDDVVNRASGSVDHLYVRILLVIILAYIAFALTSLTVEIKRNTKIIERALEAIEKNDKPRMGR